MNTETKTILHVWDASMYIYEDAKQDQAVRVIECPSNMKDPDSYFMGIIEGLKVAGDVLAGDTHKVWYKIVTLKSYRVTQTLMEINSYMGNVWAEDENDLSAIMSESDVISQGDYQIEEWAVSNNPEDDKKWSLYEM